MLQKVAAIVNKVAADLCFRASKARLLLRKKFFEFAATSAATLKYRNSLRYAQKSYKSKLTPFARTLYSVINCNRSAFWGTSQNATAES